MTKTVVIVGFLVAFAAGLVVGLDRHRSAPLPDDRHDRHGGWLTAELNLTPEQQEQMKKIWSETAREGGRDREDRRRQLFKQRDEAIAGLIRPEDKPRYDELVKDFARQLDELDGQWRGSFQKAIEETKKILTPEQAARYEELLKKHHTERGQRERRKGERGPASHPPQ